MPRKYPIRPVRVRSQKLWSNRHVSHPKFGWTNVFRTWAVVERCFSFTLRASNRTVRDVARDVSEESQPRKHESTPILCIKLTLQIHSRNENLHRSCSTLAQRSNHITKQWIHNLSLRVIPDSIARATMAPIVLAPVEMAILEVADVLVGIEDLVFLRVYCHHCRHPWT